MADFTGETEVPVFDLLTIIVMIEQCDPDLTMVTYYDDGLGWVYWSAANRSWDSNRLRPAPMKRKTCLGCLLKEAANRRSEDGRAAVIEAVKRDALHVASITPRAESEYCSRCQAHLMGGFLIP